MLVGRILWTKRAGSARTGSGGPPRWPAVAAAVLLALLLALGFWFGGGGERPASLGSASPAAPAGRLVGSESEAGSVAADGGAASELPSAGPLRWLPPARGKVATPYGWRYVDALRDWRLHAGWDVAVSEGAPAVATAAGRVASIAAEPGWGEVVTLELGGGWSAVYRGLALVSVREGELLPPGATIGRIARAVAAEPGEGPHLHWEVREDGAPVDPAGLPGLALSH